MGSRMNQRQRPGGSAMNSELTWGNGKIINQVEKI